MATTQKQIAEYLSIARGKYAKARNNRLLITGGIDRHELALGSLPPPRAGEDKRMTMIWKFSTHPKIDDSNGREVVSWVIDCELERNITALLQSDLNASTESLAKLFLKNFSSESLARRHLSSYLEKVGYQVGNRVHRQLSEFQQYTQLRFDQRDVWQIGWLFASDPAKFFSNFKPQYALENYAARTMEGKIKDEIFRLGQWRMCSDWALLKYSTRTSLQNALQNQGYSQPQLDRYLAALDCFKEIYACRRPTGSRSLPAPTDEQFNEIANVYNRQVQPPQLATLATIQDWLKTCIQALRNCQTRNVISIDAPSSRDEDSVQQQLGNTPDSEMEHLENQETAEQLMVFLAKLLEHLEKKDKQTDNYLLLRHGFDLDYRSIAPIFGISHSTVRYRYNQAMQRLLLQVAQWAQQQLGEIPDSETLNNMRDPLQQCLDRHYKDRIFQSVFQNARQQLDGQRRNLLHLRYFWKMNEAQISHKLQRAESEVGSGLVTGRQELAVAIGNWIQNRPNFPPDSLNLVADKIATAVQVLIANYPYNTII